MRITLRVAAPDGTARRYEMARAVVRVGAGAHDDLFLPIEPPIATAVTLRFDEEGVEVDPVDAAEVPIRIDPPDGSSVSGKLPRGTVVSIGAPSWRIHVDDFVRIPRTRCEAVVTDVDAPRPDLPAASQLALLRLLAVEDAASRLAMGLVEPLRDAGAAVVRTGLALPGPAGEEWIAYTAWGGDVRPAMEALRGSVSLAFERLAEGAPHRIVPPEGRAALALPVRAPGRSELAGVLFVTFAGEAPAHEAPSDDEAIVLAMLHEHEATLAQALMRLRRIEELLVQQEENRFFRERQRRHDLFKDLVALSPAMRDVHRRLGMLVAGDAPVLLLGEAGAGKEMLARALHHLGTRSEGMQISLTCTTLDDDQLEYALFGYGGTQGASRPGALELARGGTVFLDEVHALGPASQARLVRAIQESEVFRTGEAVARRIDARVIAATHLDLQQLADEGRFRRDLALLLTATPLALPPLRDRREDIPGLVDVFVRQFARRYRRQAEKVDADTMRWLASLEWPGNVRELLTLVERAVLHAAPESTMLTRADFAPLT